MQNVDKYIKQTARITCSAAIILVFGFSAFVQADSQLLSRAMAEHLECYPLELLSLDRQKPSITRKDLCLAAIYHETGARPLWVLEDGPGERAETVFKYLKQAYQEGLDPLDYQVDILEELWPERSFSSLARLDTLITFNVIKYMHDISYGQLKVFEADPQLFAEAGESGYDPLAAIEKLLSTKNLELFFHKLPPQHIHYQALKKALESHRLISLFGQWETIPGGKVIFPGDEDGRIPAIRQCLSLAVKASQPLGSLNLYDEKLAEIVKTFQFYHGLKTDGIIGSMTLEELNISPQKRIAQIKINMARWRWQDHDLGKKYVLVNIADFQLYGYSNGILELSLPVIVGAFQHQTPVFSDRIKYLEFHPYWNVPPSIAQKEDLPKLRKDPRYLVDRNIRLFSSWQGDAVELDSTVIDWSQVSSSQIAGYKLRQDPGPFNALGKIKFVFPNVYDVYLHDTPAKNLFAEYNRFFSHGCIRVSDPQKLAVFVLQGNGDWSESKVKQAAEEQIRQVVRLTSPLPIHITYLTAWVDKEGQIHFNRDFYGRDEKLYKAFLLK